MRYGQNENDTGYIFIRFFENSAAIALLRIKNEVYRNIHNDIKGYRLVVRLEGK